MVSALRVLIVSDDADRLRGALSVGEHAPVLLQVPTAAALTAALADSQWNIVVFDHALSDITALAALHLCRAVNPDLPFIVVSDLDRAEPAMELLRAGANDYLLKRNLCQLAAVVERVVREAAQHQARQPQADAQRLQRVEAELHLFRAWVDHTRDIFEVIDPATGRFLDVNQHACQAHGYTREEYLQLSVSDIVPPPISKPWQEWIKNRPFPTQLFESLHMRKDGSVFPVEVSFNVVRIDRDYMIAVVRDITARKLAEAQQARDALILAHVCDSVIVLDAQHRVTYWNDGAMRIFGWTAAEMVGRYYFDRYPESLRTAFANQFTTSIREQGWSSDFEDWRKDGSRVWINFRVSYITDEAGQVIGVLGVSKEITERKRAEEILAESEARLRVFVEHVSAPIAMLDRDLRYLHVSRRWLTDYRLGDRNLTGLSHYEVFPDVPLEWKAIHQRCLAGATDCCDEYRFVRQDGRVQWIRWEIRPWLQACGDVGGIIMFTEDITARKQSEEALRTSEERYRVLIEATAAIVWNTPASGEFETEQTWGKFTGQTFAEYRGWGWLTAIHADDQAKTAQVWRTAVATRTVYEVEHRLRRADGVYRQMTARAVPILAPDGTLREWVGIHTDVTDQRRIETERADLLAQLTIQIERMPLAYLLSGPDFRYRHWNPAAERMFGYSAAEALGKHWFDLIVPTPSRELMTDLIARLAQGEMNAHGMSENRTQYGQIIFCEWLHTPLFDPNGAFQGVFSLAQDVTLRRRAEQAVHETQQWIKHVVDSSPAVLFALTLADQQIDGINWISENLRNVLGYAPKESFQPNWWSDNLHAEDRAETIARTQENLFICGRSTHEYRFRHQNGQYVWIRSEIRLIRDESGAAVEAVGAWTDITARKLLEDQFRQAQKMEAFGQLAGGVAHDFNNMLTVINGYSDLLLQSLSPDDPSQELVAEILKAGERSAALTQQLLAFTRQQVLAPRTLNLNNVVANTDKMLRRLIGEDVRLMINLDAQLGAVRADAGQIEQVLLNLAINARDAMPRGGQLTIGTHNVELGADSVHTHDGARMGAHVCMRVTDTGMGMAPVVLAHIFEPFFTTKEPGKGTGLGLATVYGIVAQSGGHVAVESTVGVGTTFNVYLPRIDHAAKHALGPARTVTPPQGTETILLAEDEVGVRTLARFVLEQCGYRVLEALDGDEAVRMAAEYDRPIHLLLTDVVMPGLGGRAVAEQLVLRDPHIRVLFMSGHTDDAVLRYGVLRNGANFLQKPFTPIALALKVREILDRRIESWQA